MIKLEIDNNLDWIINNLDEFNVGAKWNGNFVSHLLPNRFKRYVKILHSIYEDPSIKDKETTWNHAEQKNIENFWNRRIKRILSKSTMTFCSPDEDFEGIRIKWNDLASRYNMPIRKTINVDSFINHFPQGSFPRYLIGPSLGLLRDHENVELINILSPYCTNSECYFYFDSLIFDDPMRYDLYKGKLSELLKLVNDNEFTSGFSPTYIWSENIDWCLNTDYDLSFSVLGCDDEIAEQFLNSETLESIEVDISTRIDYMADVQ